MKRANRTYITKWTVIGICLLGLGTALYVLLEYPLVQFFSVLVGEAGLLFVITDLLEKQLLRELASRIIGEVRKEVGEIESQVGDRLRQSFDLLDNAMHSGLVDVLPPRRDQAPTESGEAWSERTPRAMNDNLMNCRGVLRLSGISLLDFFLVAGRGGEFFEVLQKKAQRDELEVRVLLMDPRGHGIRLRKHVELNGPASPLLQIEASIPQAVGGIDVLRQIAERAGNAHFSIEPRLYSFLPQAYFVVTDSALFIEQYHFAETENLRFWGEEETSPCTGGRVPILHFANPSNAYTAMLKHFDTIWNLGASLGPEMTVRAATGLEGQRAARVHAGESTRGLPESPSPSVR